MAYFRHFAHGRSRHRADLGGYLVEYVNWRWIFTINLPIGVVGILLAWFVLPDFQSKHPGKLDFGGAFSAAVTLFCILLALSKGEEWGWTDERIVLLFAASFFALVLFIYIELTVKNPLLELRVFKYRSFMMANLLVVVTTVGMYAGIFYLPLFLQSVRGLGAMQTGLLLMPGALASGLMMSITGRLYDKIGPTAPRGLRCVHAGDPHLPVPQPEPPDSDDDHRRVGHPPRNGDGLREHARTDRGPFRRSDRPRRAGFRHLEHHQERGRLLGTRGADLDPHLAPSPSWRQARLDPGAQRPDRRVHGIPDRQGLEAEGEGTRNGARLPQRDGQSDFLHRRHRRRLRRRRPSSPSWPSSRHFS